MLPLRLRAPLPLLLSCRPVRRAHKPHPGVPASAAAARPAAQDVVQDVVQAAVQAHLAEHL